MENNPIISQALAETEGYKDLAEPVILASGELGIYYVNTEKLLQDNGAFNAFGDNANQMLKHAFKMMEEKPKFKQVIEVISKKAEVLLPQNPYCAVSGGQRRDWLFSGPVAYTLGLPHVAVYKNGKIELSYQLNDGSVAPPRIFPQLKNTRVIHIADLITEGSSVYHIEDGREKGWAPSLYTAGARIDDLIAVVTRQQGGEEMLSKHGVNVHSFVAIDQNFLKKYSKNPEQACAYNANPKEWSENYLKEHGALALWTTFDPKGGKLDRAKRFLTRYEKVLETTGKLDELKNAVQKKYGVSLEAQK